MRCPLCKTDVADDNGLQVHYLMTCNGFVDEQTAEQRVSRSSRYHKIQLQWVKTVATQSREVYLISSLSGSVKLEWSEAYKCYLSEPTEVLCGLHSCQLIVDGDALTTQDFEVGTTTDVVEINVMQEGSDISVASGKVSERSSNLYEELMNHQILHGDSLDQLVSDGATSDNQPTTSRLSRKDVANLPQTSGEDAGDSEVLVTGRIPDGHDGITDEISPDNNAENNHNGATSGHHEGTGIADDSSPDNHADDDHHGVASDHDDTGITDGSSPADHAENNNHDGVTSNHEDTEDDHYTVMPQQEPLLEDAHSGDGGVPYQQSRTPPNVDNQIIVFGDSMTNISDQPNDDGDHTINDHGAQSTTTMPYHEPRITEIPVVGEDSQQSGAWIPNSRSAENTRESDNLITFEIHDDNTATDPPVNNRMSSTHRHTLSDQMTILDHGSTMEDRGHGSIGRGGIDPVTDYDKSSPVALGGDVTPGGSDAGDQAVDASSVSGGGGGVTGIMADGRNDGSGRSDVGSSNGGGGGGVTGIMADGRNDGSGRSDIGSNNGGGGGSGDSDLGSRSTPDFETPTTVSRFIFSPTSTSDTRANTSPGFTSTNNQSTITDDMFSNYKIYRPPSYKPTQAWSSTSDLGTGGGDYQSGIESRHFAAMGHQPSSDNPISKNTTTNTDNPTYNSKPVSAHVTEIWSDDRIRELLDSLKEPRGSSRITSAFSRQPTVQKIEQPSTSAPNSTEIDMDTEAVIQLREKLAEQDSYIKKLQTKYSLLKKEMIRAHEKETELGKALSLVETRKVAAKEQEEIMRHITTALTRKERECSELQREVDELRKTERLRQKELETTKKLHDIKVKEMKKQNDSLADQVRILDYSSPSGRGYKDLLEKYTESVAKNASIYDQMKLLEKRNKELGQKLSEYKIKQRSPIRLSASQPVLVTNHVTNGDASFNTNRLEDYIGDSSVSRHSYGLGHDYSPVMDQNSRKIRDNNAQVSQDVSTFGRYVTEPYLVRNVNDIAPPRRASTDATVMSSDDTDINPHIFRNTRSYSSDSIVRTTSTNDRSSEGLRNATSRATPAYNPFDLRKYERPKEAKRRDRPHSFHSGFNNDTTSYTTPSAVKHHTTDLTLRCYAYDRSTSSDYSTVACESAVKPCHERGKPFAPGSPQELDKGMSVLITRACGKIGRGEVKYIGKLPTKNDVYIGLELNKKEGKHDGQFNGQRFFKCKHDHGIFVPFNKVVMAYF